MPLCLLLLQVAWLPDKLQMLFCTALTPAGAVTLLLLLLPLLLLLLLLPKPLAQLLQHLLRNRTQRATATEQPALPAVATAAAADCAPLAGNSSRHQPDTLQ
jgi:hypothetical protein